MIFNWVSHWESSGFYSSRVSELDTAMLPTANWHIAITLFTQGRYFRPDTLQGFTGSCCCSSSSIDATARIDPWNGLIITNFSQDLPGFKTPGQATCGNVTDPFSLCPKQRSHSRKEAGTNYAATIYALNHGWSYIYPDPNSSADRKCKMREPF